MREQVQRGSAGDCEWRASFLIHTLVLQSVCCVLGAVLGKAEKQKQGSEGSCFVRFTCW